MAFTRFVLEGIKLHRATSIEPGPLCVFFGPNGSGKTTLLDAFGYLHLAVRRDLRTAANEYFELDTWTSRGWPEGAMSSIAIQGNGAHYRVFPVRLGNKFYWNEDAAVSGDAPFAFVRNDNSLVMLIDGKADGPPRNLIQPEQTSWPQVLASELPPKELIDFHKSLLSIRHFRCRDWFFPDLRRGYSTITSDKTLKADGGNIWSVLRNLRDSRRTLGYLDRVIHFLAKAFPGFQAFEFNQVTDRVIAARILEEGWKDPYPMSSCPDGIFQMALVLTALYSDGEGEYTILLDEPDLSLHPWAQFVLAEAIEDATKNWGRQVMIATHSPTLLNEFPEDSLYLMMPKDGQTTIQRVSDMEEPRDLLNQYSTGSLYMSQLVGEQSSEPMAKVVPIDE